MGLASQGLIQSVAPGFRGMGDGLGSLGLRLCAGSFICFFFLHVGRRGSLLKARPTGCMWQEESFSSNLSEKRPSGSFYGSRIRDGILLGFC